MSDSKHTPGPWGVEWQHPCYWIIRDESGSGVHLPPGSAIDDPNRLLIERAPETKRQRDELLEALETMVLDLEQNGEVFGTDDKRIQFMQKAIAKATKEEA